MGDAHRPQQVPAGPHAHEPRVHRRRWEADGALPPAQAFDAAELNPSSMSCATGAESMATIRTTARNLCVEVTHVRGEGKKRVHFTTRQANKYGNEPPRQAGIWCEYRVDGKFTFPKL